MMEQSKEPSLLIFISTCTGNAARRRAIRRSWFQYKLSEDSPLTLQQRQRIQLVFIACKGHEELITEAATQGDILLLDTPEGYDMLWRKALVFLQTLVRRCNATSSSHTDTTQNKDEGDSQNNDVGESQWPGWTGPASHPTFVMHADDDSYVRLDLLLKEMDAWPRTRNYWGYIWDGTGARCTAPIRNPLNKSYMPESQYAPDFYPPFASGCGFVLSWDLVAALAEAAPTLPDYRLLDPPFGIHLCGAPELCVVQPPIIPVHEECVRPYRPLPTFRPDTIVQHYLKAEEMRPFHSQALESFAAAAHGTEASVTAASCAKSNGLGNGNDSASHLYDTLVTMGLLRR